MARRVIRPWPRRLRWRLVLGFALSVALLQVVLIGTERFLLQQTLTQSIKQSLQETINTGLSSSMLGYWMSGDSANVDSTAYVNKMLTGGWRKKDIALLKRSFVSLTAAVNVSQRLAVLAKSLALPDQPVAMLDTQGRLLAHAGSLALDRKRAAPLAPAVLKTLLATATKRAGKLRGEWTGQISTPDGPYLALLRQAEAPVLTQRQADEALKILTYGPKMLLGPDGRKVLQDPRPSRLVVLIAHRLADMQQTVQAVTVISLGGALAVIALATLLSLLVVGRALRPLGAITRGAERLAQGDYSHRVALDAGSDEVGRLGASFNAMAGAIATAFATQRRFVADASHELRTPLTALRGYTDVLAMGVGDEDQATVERVLGAMQEDLGRMSRLVDDLLTLARLDGGAALRLSPVALDDLLEAAAHEGRALARGRQRIIAAPVSRDLVIRGDRDRLRQVLSNIVGNACAYSLPDSTIVLRAEPGEQWAIVEIQDDGPGIPPNDLTRLGERFYRGDTARSRGTGGTGLGLAIARAIVEAHGGTLAVDSTLGVGTTVTIRLPRTPLKATLPAPNAEAHTASA